MTDEPKESGKTEAMAPEVLDPQTVRRGVQTTAALAWLDKFWNKPRVCPICQHTAWTVSSAFELRERPQTLGSSASAGLPVFSAVCTTCGHTYFFNALVAGIVKPDGSAK